MTPTAKEIRESNEAEALAAHLRGTDYEPVLDQYPLERIETESGALCIQIGPIQVLAGEDPKKPVIRDAHTKRAMKGSGRFKRGDKPAVPPELAYRETTEYRERFSQLMIEGDVDEYGSDAYIYDQAMKLAAGVPTEVDCPHPELHTSDLRRRNGPVKHIVIQVPDKTTINNLLRMKFGNAPTQININKKEHRLVESLEYRVHEVRLQGFDTAEADTRKQLIEGFGYELESPLEGSFAEVETPAAD